MQIIYRLLFYILLALPIMMTVNVHAQTELSKLEPEEYFDFWVGHWDLTWEAPDGTTETGSNRIEKILDGNVLLENFRSESGRFKGYEGKSFSVYHKTTGKWRQTWVDDSNEYIDLTGKFEGNKRIFVTEGPGPGGKNQLKRMVFYNITDSSFTWDWESSVDDGKTWKLMWRIHYRRQN
ncbi:DUF1579 domain-containing protein [Aliifodinibius sp. S!AR15-10]|uniref:hypothetical protein n=1 Tax=Aliifodinibius sp. S!AR15-10 TaxID=2950437 RepID=UPI00286417BD|nr:hypothetical protein [Aliifodinibius sp. S!AR15-10]MDR8391286.1 DUF1579 domain-containing protein [Aliifodinibius sp. S!AR15-10]